jgi:hypothetical protein
MGRKKKQPESLTEEPALPAVDQPDLRACYIWVLRNLDEEDPKAPPDKIALALHGQCKADPKFLSSFISSTFSRMMASDEASGQDKFTANNDDLTDLIKFSREHAARDRLSVPDSTERT